MRKKYNTVLIACAKPAARRWLPQALALPTFCDVFAMENVSGVVRCGTEF